MGLDQTLSQFVLFLTTVAGAVVAALWLGMVLWTWHDMRARSNDVLAQVAGSLVVAVLNVFGLIIYLMLRPRETLSEAYERSLEEEALLQGIEEKPACPGCGRPSNVAWQVCPYCHTRLKKPCQQCSQLLELPWNVCPFCATVQTGTDGEGRQRSAARARRPSTADDFNAAPNNRRRPDGQVQRPRRADDQYDTDAQRAASLEFVDGDDL